VETAWDLALAKAGNNSAARMAMMAMTTSNSIRVNPRSLSPPGFSESELFIWFIAVPLWMGKQSETGG
tara:strand:- start:311 stop:514 length:204 start_codon:yes stop_codon:yes gene_type:complete